MITIILTIDSVVLLPLLKNFILLADNKEYKLIAKDVIFRHKNNKYTCRFMDISIKDTETNAESYNEMAENIRKASNVSLGLPEELASLVEEYGGELKISFINKEDFYNDNIS